MIYEVIRQTPHLIAQSLCHLCKAFRLYLVLKRECREYRAISMNSCSDKSASASNRIQWYCIEEVRLSILVSHINHEFAMRHQFRVSYEGRIALISSSLYFIKSFPTYLLQAHLQDQASLETRDFLEFPANYSCHTRPLHYTNATSNWVPTHPCPGQSAPPEA